MAKKSTVKITGVKASSIAMFEGTLGSIIGLAVAIIYSLNKTVNLASQTNSVLAGLAFGMAAGIVAIIVLPFVYFGIGWVIGYVHGWIFNTVIGASGGIDVNTQE